MKYLRLIMVQISNTLIGATMIPLTLDNDYNHFVNII
jgi:hypothetical protein